MFPKWTNLFFSRERKSVTILCSNSFHKMFSSSNNLRSKFFRTLFTNFIMHRNTELNLILITFIKNPNVESIGELLKDDSTKTLGCAIDTIFVILISYNINRDFITA